MIFTKQQLELLEPLNKINGYFKAEEFFASETADKHNIINLPKTRKEAIEVIKNLTVLINSLDYARRYILKKPIIVNSGYRCLMVNRLVGSRDNSQHIKGQAADIICPEYGNPASVFLALRMSKIQVDQCLLENSWIHFAVKESENRNIWGKLINGKFELVK